jgi:hypothetical protein
MAAVTLLLLAYFLPALMAIARRHQSWFEIVSINLFLGWTVLGWIFALIWSLTAPRWQSAVIVSERFHGSDELELAHQRFTQR